MSLIGTVWWLGAGAVNLGREAGGVAIAQSDLFPQSEPAEAARGGRRLSLLLLILILGVVSLLIHALMPLGWNVTATRAVQSVRFTGLSELMRHISGFGNASKMVFVTAIALVACDKSREAFWLGFSGLGGWLMAMQLKSLFASARPPPDLVTVFHQWDTASFPSGHVVFYVCFFGFIFFLAWERITAGRLLRRGVMFVAAAMILLVGISRVYVGEHWVSDLPGSYLLGGLWLTLSVNLYRRSGQGRGPHDWFLPNRVMTR